MKAPWPGPLGPPPDVAALLACAAAVLVAWQGRRVYAALTRAPRALAIGAMAAAALGLSAAYVTVYLRGGPRIIDATSYWLQARALAEGHVTWSIDDPSASWRGRFLLSTGEEGHRLGVIFPPGYAVLLALGFLAGHPMAVGPALAFVLVWLTYALAREVSDREDVARIAAALSVLSAGLRYHTADTMSHGWAATLLTAAILFGYRARRRARWSALNAALSGLALGWLFATRPLSGAMAFPLLALILWRTTLGCRATVTLAALAPLGALVWQQRAVTGELFHSSQAAYYALADGPPGCFRFGFGAGIGCRHEHGAYVDSVLPQGLDWRAALITSLRRLRLHSIDVANAEPLALLAFAAPWLLWAPRPRARSGEDPARAPARTRVLAFAPWFIVVAYAPFYFDGSYPGGGARFLADVLPLEHVLIGCVLAAIAERAELHARTRHWNLARLSTLSFALSLGGFGVHAVFEHLALRDREGGRPFFEPEVLRAAGVAHGVLLITTDHGFNLAYDPKARDPQHDLVVAREHGDDRDRLLWDRLGRPAAYRYSFDDVTGPTVARWWPPHPYDVPSVYRYEAEAEWPPLAQSGGYFEPVPARGTCAWGGALLAIHPAATQPFQGAIAVPVPFAGRFAVAVHVASRGNVVARLAFRRAKGAAPLATWAFAAQTGDFTCATLTEEDADLVDGARLEITAREGGELWLDAVALKPSAVPSAQQP